MKIVVIGGTGLIGSKVVAKLKQRGHDAIAAVPSTGVNTLTGEGLAPAMKDTEIVIDVSNSPSFEDNAVMNFFETSTKNILAAEAAAGVKHHLALSVVGTERLQGSGYFRAKMAQEKQIKASKVPWTILHATQFFEFMGGIAQSATEGDTVRVSSAMFQPISSEDVAETLTKLALEAPKNTTVEVAGPEKFKMNELVGFFLDQTKDKRKVVGDSHAKYFGTEINDQSLVPSPGAIMAKTNYKEWLPNNMPPK
jgi:uncharacterized protein YbjT (DUF2867 family)